jgi:hypothetical protein
MTTLFSPSEKGFYVSSEHSTVPNDAIKITAEQHAYLLDGINQGKHAVLDDAGQLILIDPPPYVPTVDELCARIDTTADAARRAVAGDPLRAVEYDRARLAAEQFAAAGYEGEVPAMVAAWAINGRTPQQAADSILAEAAAYTHALELLRTTRLAAKEHIRTLMAANQVEQAQQLTDQTIASIETAVAGIGNNA